MIRHALTEGWLLLRSRGLVSPVLAIAMAIPISLAGVTISVRQWLEPVVDLGERDSIVVVLLHPRLDAAGRQAWVAEQARRRVDWRIEQVPADELAGRLATWFPYLEELLEREGEDMLPPMVEITTRDPHEVLELKEDPRVLAVGPTSSVNLIVGRVAKRFARVLFAVAGALMAGALLFAAVWVHLELHRNAEEIAIMRLMGATESTVRGPFLVAVAAPAVLAAGTSVVLTVGALHWLARLAAPVGLVATGSSVTVLVVQVMVALVLPMAAALITLERHASEDD